MAEHSAIAWTHATFNIVIGCTRVSEGCVNCYAEQLARRRGWAEWGPTAERKVMSADYWRQPLRWNRAAEAAGERRRVFCSSLADVFEDHSTVTAERERLWPLIRQTPALDWLLLTKRPERIAESLPADWGEGYPNVWLGATAENQKRLEQRVRALAEVPAAVRFLSCEPLVERITFGVDPYSTVPRGLLGCPACNGWGSGETGSVSADGHPYERECSACQGTGAAIDLVIVGGESGPNARPFEPAWAVEIIGECSAASVAVFVKQMGSVWAKMHGAVDRSGSDMAEWPEELRVRQMPGELAAAGGAL